MKRYVHGWNDVGLSKFHGKFRTQETDNLFGTIASIMVLLEATTPGALSNIVRKVNEYLNSRATKSYKNAMMASGCRGRVCGPKPYDG